MDDESMVIQPVITSSSTRNPPQEWESARNYHLIDERFNRGRREGIPPGITG
jgi:hypothetical protein